MALLDEAMVSVVSGELLPTVAGTVYCSLIEACEEISELQRAQEWTDALTRWCERQEGMLTFNGQCLTHRSSLLSRHGEWVLAAREARRACDMFRGAIDAVATGGALYQLAEVQRMSGDDADAEQSYQGAREWGRDPQPGLALLRLQQGRIDQAAAMMRRTVAEAQDDIERCRLLSAFIEVMLAADEADPAAAAADDLEELADRFGTSALRAEAWTARGRVLLQQDDARSALNHLRKGYEAWRAAGVPYEAARARVLVGLACRRAGDEDSARLEWDAAAQVFGDLGAEPALTSLRRLRGDAVKEHPLSDRELEVMRLVASGLTNREIADQLFVAVKTVDRHVANILAKLAVPSRTAATAWAYEHQIL
jgi:DNA-binding NarL/FixJ family response regulator